MKPGYLSTEFWLTVLVGVLVNANAIEVPEKYRWIVNCALVIGYAISRGMAKTETGDGGFVPTDNADSVITIDLLEQENRKLKLETAARKAEPAGLERSAITTTGSTKAKSASRSRKRKS